MSSSQLFVGLPTLMLACAPMLSPAFHVAAFWSTLIRGVMLLSLLIFSSYVVLLFM